MTGREQMTGRERVAGQERASERRRVAGQRQAAERGVVMTDPKKQDYFYNEAMKTLRTNIQFAGRDIKTVLVTSCFPNEGKSDVTFQLAREIGNMGKRVLFIDADIRKSNFLSRYQVRRGTCGLSQYLSGQREREDICFSTNFENVDIIFAGTMAPNPSELLEDKSFRDLLAEKRERYDYILIDTPPVGSLIDAAIIAKFCDGAILVIESERVSYRMAQRAKEQIELTGCHVIGAVLNKVDMAKERYYGKYYGKYGRYGKYGKYYGYYTSEK